MSSLIPDPLGNIGSTDEAMVSLPSQQKQSPTKQLLMRGAIGLMLLVITTLIVWLDRGSYRDNTNGDGISLLDAFYYATVTVTTTGYGDITPVAEHARLINAVVITPLRIIFLVLLVGTTLEVLATEGRRVMMDNRWRRRMRNHIVIIGYGTKGRSALRTLERHGKDLTRIVAIDSAAQAIADANADGIAAIQGPASRRETLQRAEISKAREVMVTLDRDDTTILTSLMIRQLNPTAHLVVAVRERVNVALLRQCGADAVITSSAAVGRLLGLAAVSPAIGSTFEDLLTSGVGLEVGERQVAPEEVGKAPIDITPERVVAVVRNRTLRRYYDPVVARLEAGDKLVVVRKADAPKEVRDIEERVVFERDRGSLTDD
ncbi:potassium channel family protein [Granulicoccus phenolivorans]|uniref:potassium channel family protein n=1 Tax=Granulicoccus phenolivorans TaxID=266854 RepID=UPI00040F83A1|nr:potassium channel family protein [Granulicoccus phenolivorans]